MSAVTVILIRDKTWKCDFRDFQKFSYFVIFDIFFRKIKWFVRKKSDATENTGCPETYVLCLLCQFALMVDDEYYCWFGNADL